MQKSAHKCPGEFSPPRSRNRTRPATADISFQVPPQPVTRPPPFQTWPLPWLLSPWISLAIFEYYVNESYIRCLFRIWFLSLVIMFMIVNNGVPTNKKKMLFWWMKMYSSYFISVMWSSLFIYFFFLILGCTLGMPGQRSNPHHSIDLSHSSDNTKSLTACTTRKLLLFCSIPWLNFWPPELTARE